MAFGTRGKSITYEQVKAALAEAGAGEEELDYLKRFRSLKPLNRFKEYRTVDEFFAWASENLISYVEREEAERRVAKAQANAVGIQEEDPEALIAAEEWAEEAKFVGSPKQVKWARSIAKNHCVSICEAWGNKKTLPLSASWWIENRTRINAELKVL